MGEVFVSGDLFLVLQPWIQISKIAGFCPITFRRKGNSCLLKRSLKLWIYSYTLGTLLMLNTAIGISKDAENISPVMVRNSIIAYVLSSDISQITFTAFAMTVSTPFKLKSFWEVLDCLREFDRVLRPRSPKNDRRKSLVVICAFLGFTLVVQAVDFLIWFKIAARVGATGTFLQKGVTLYTVYFCVFIKQTAHWQLTFLIRRRIEALNLCLENAGEDALKKLDKVWISTIEVVSRRNFANFNILSHDQVTQLMKLHNLISKATEATNNFCSIDVLLILLSVLIHLVTTAYLFCVELINHGFVPFIVIDFAWTVLHLIRLLMVVEACQGCLDESRRTVHLVYKLLSCELQEDVKEQLENFASLLRHKKLTFSAFALINIDRSLVTSVSSSVATFLVILFQFDHAENAAYFSTNSNY